MWHFEFDGNGLDSLLAWQFDIKFGFLIFCVNLHNDKNVKKNKKKRLQLWGERITVNEQEISIMCFKFVKV